MKAKYVKENKYALELTLGESYEVVAVDQYTWYTDVYLEGIQAKFNSVIFEYDDEEEFDNMCAESFKENYNLAGD